MVQVVSVEYKFMDPMQLVSKNIMLISQEMLLASSIQLMPALSKNHLLRNRSITSMVKNKLMVSL